jgi:hypothetical protein
LIIGVRVAKTTNAFCSKGVMSGAVMRETRGISGDG